MVDRDPERPDDDLDPDAPASAEEVAASKRLRDALEGRAAAGASPEIDLALALRAAWDPGAMSADESRAMLDATPSAGEQDHAAQLREALASKAEPPALIVYHPKFVAAGVTGKEATVGDKCPLEIVPATVGGKTRFQLLAAGKPVENAEGSLTRPDGKKEALKTDKDGFTAAFEPTGRYAATLRHTEAKAGEYEGKKYAEAKHYATLVVDVK